MKKPVEKPRVDDLLEAQQEVFFYSRLLLSVDLDALSRVLEARGTPLPPPTILGPDGRWRLDPTTIVVSPDLGADVLDLVRDARGLRDRFVRFLVANGNRLGHQTSLGEDDPEEPPERSRPCRSRSLTRPASRTAPASTRSATPTRATA